MPDSRPPIAFSGLPLLPLAATLFPGGLMSLRIFEERYLRAFPGCHMANAPFGVVTLAQEQQAPTAGVPPENFYFIGTLAHITVFEEIGGHRLLQLQCEGGQRFRIHSLQRLSSGLWISDASRVAYDMHVPVPDDLKPAAQALSRARKGHNLTDPQTGYYDDCGWVANRWGELLPMPLADRQRLMALENPLLRLELVADMLGPAELGDTD